VQKGSPLKVLIVGYGSIGRRHMQTVQNARIDAQFAVYRHRIKNEFVENGCFFSGNINSCLDWKPDVSIICSPAPMHLQFVPQLLDSGSHLLIEKPISHNLDGVRELVELVGSSGVAVSVGYNLRFMESLKVFRSAVQRKVCGEVRFVSSEVGQYLPDWRPNQEWRSTVTAQSKLGGGVLLELSHEIDYLLWVFGEFNWVSAYLGHISPFGEEVEDFAALTLSVCGETSGTPSPIINVSMDLVRRKAERKCRVFCEEGTIIWDGIKNKVTVEKFQGEQILFNGENMSEDTYLEQFEDFLSLVTVGKESESLAFIEDAAKALAVVDAARNSHELEGQRIFLNAADYDWSSR
jgi:predicted dehydrogenase